MWMRNLFAGGFTGGSKRMWGKHMKNERLIDANAFLKRLSDHQIKIAGYTEKIEEWLVLEKVISDLKNLPTIDPETLRAVARLEPVDPESDIEFKRSKCEGVISTDWDGSEYFEYCPYCGARVEDSI